MSPLCWYKTWTVALPSLSYTQGSWRPRTSWGPGHNWGTARLVLSTCLCQSGPKHFLPSYPCRCSVCKPTQDHATSPQQSAVCICAWQCAGQQLTRTILMHVVQCRIPHQNEKRCSKLPTSLHAWMFPCPQGLAAAEWREGCLLHCLHQSSPNLFLCNICISPTVLSQQALCSTLCFHPLSVVLASTRLSFWLPLQCLWQCQGCLPWRHWNPSLLLPLSFAPEQPVCRAHSVLNDIVTVG